MAVERFAGTHAVVLGGAGFLGSHLCDRLVGAGARVTAIDNFSTGDPGNVAHLVGQPGFTLVQYDVTNFLHVPGEVDWILHFASPASPIDYLRIPIQTLKVGALGTHKALGLALAKGARLLLASTSEVYGDPQVNPQPETYWGNVNPIGPRGVYDEAKRFAESMTLAYTREHGVETRIVRIFNSVLAHEQVLYDDGVELRREPVSALAERLGGARRALDGFTVPAFDASGTVEPSPTIALEGHPTSARCYRVTTRYGRFIDVTGDHSLFVEGDDGRPVARPVSQLTTRDRVAVQARVRVPERDRASVSFCDLWRERERDAWQLFVAQDGLAELITERSRMLTLRVAERRGNVTAAGLRSAGGTVSRWRSAGELPLGLFDELGCAVGETTTVRRSRSRVHVPERLVLDDEVLWLLGLHVAEGGRYEGRSGSFMHLSGQAELLDRAHKIIERALGLHVVRVVDDPTLRSDALFVHSALLLELLDHLGFAAGEKRLPGWVLGLPLGRLKHVLEGYREGAGVHSGAKLAEGRRHEFSTTSTALKNDLIVALARFGLVPSVGAHVTRSPRGERRPFWRLTLASVAPWSPLDWDRGVEQTLQARRTGDLVWARVRRIEEIAATPLVYDFVVPGRENFWAGGGIAAHNTYGERMQVEDGRVIPAFFKAALLGRPLPVQGDGQQTRSLCHYTDLVEGMLRLLLSDHIGPMNIGNTHEVTILELAQAVQDAVDSHPGVEHHPRPVDDPMVRRPDTTLARQILGWEAEVGLADGLARTAPYFRGALGLG